MGMYMVSYDLSHPEYNNEKVNLSKFLMGTDRLVICEVPDPEKWVINKKLNWKNKIYNTRHKNTNKKIVINWQFQVRQVKI